jgi:hypothetical protein
MIQQRWFTKEFEEEAVRQVQTSGRTQREIVPYRANDGSRRISPSASPLGEGRVTEATAAARRIQSGPLFVPVH